MNFMFCIEMHQVRLEMITFTEVITKITKLQTFILQQNVRRSECKTINHLAREEYQDKTSFFMLAASYSESSSYFCDINQLCTDY